MAESARFKKRSESWGVTAAVLLGLTVLLTLSAFIVGWLTGDGPAGGLALAGFMGAVCAGCFFRSKSLERQSAAAAKEEKRLDETAARKAARRDKKAQLERDYENALRQLQSNHNRAIELNDSLPALLQSVASGLELAEQEYKRGAFSPFWSAIETATERLGELSNTLAEFNRLATNHRELARLLLTRHNHQGQTFPVRLKDLQIAERGQKLSHGMDLLVGRAQTDFQFSTIYEQRRTNAILIAGFTSLGNAINGMTAKITEQLSMVVTSIETASAESSSQSAEAISMLDNIQRRRLPSAATRDY